MSVSACICLKNSSPDCTTFALKNQHLAQNTRLEEMDINSSSISTKITDNVAKNLFFQSEIK